MSAPPLTLPTTIPAPPTAIGAAPTPAHPDVPTVPIHRLSVDQYHAMIRHGVLGEDDPVELLEGWLVKKMGKKPPHRIADFLVREALRGLIRSGWYVDAQEPITTGDSEPEPDVVVVRGHTRDYFDRHPGPSDLGLVAEVSDTSLAGDQGPKQRAYARAGVPVYWIVNLVDRRVQVYTQPSGPAAEPAYNHRQDYGPGDTVPVVLDGQEVGRLAVNDLLP